MGSGLTPSKVSRRASSMKKVFVMTFVRVELSDSTSMMVETNASGPLKIARAAA